MFRKLFKSRQNTRKMQMSLQAQMDMLYFREIYTADAMKSILWLMVPVIIFIALYGLYFGITGISFFAHCSNIPGGDICKIGIDG